ncbi:MAG: MFS transporter [Candidatus Kapabacteria bacterium]|nr:MFS transporter [Candidatus Kapabacteria bacterium]
MQANKELSIKHATIYSTLISSFMSAFMGSATNVAIPTISKEFAMNAVLTSWIAASFSLSSAMVLLPVGKIADIYGRRKIFLLGLVLFVVSSLLSAIAFDGYWLIAARILQGISGAMIFATGMALIASVVPSNERGKILGYLIATVYVGLSAGPFVSGILTQFIGWRSIFWLGVIFGLLCVYFVFFKLKGEWTAGVHDKFDYKSSVIYALSLAAVMYGFSHIPHSSGYIFLSTGIVGLIVFIYVQTRVKFPLLNINLFRNNLVFSLSNLSALINYSATSAVTFLMSLFLQYIKGFSPLKAGLLIITQTIVMAVCSPIAGRMSDKIESRIIASVGMSLSATGLFMLSFLNEQSGNTYIMFCLAVLGLGFGLFSSPNTNAIMGSVEKKYLGVASATTSTMRNIGQMMSMGIATLLISIFVGNVQLSPVYHAQLMSSFHLNMIIFGGLCILGIFASLARGKHL